MSKTNKVKNFFGWGVIEPQQQIGNTPKNLGRGIVPIQLQRIKQDTATWRLAVEEMERAYFPFRVQAQQIFIDTQLNGHVSACMDRRKNLSLLRDWHIKKGNEVDEATTSLLQADWFDKLIAHSLDALFFGYSLIALGDIENGEFPNLEVIRRWNISPDRLCVVKVPYEPDGEKFLEEPFVNWHLYVSTPNNIGTSKCGYGLLYNVAIYEIFLRNVLGYNGDFVELYSQPYRIGRTNKTEGDERDTFEAAVRDMGSAGYAVIDNDGDTIDFLESALGGTGWQGYENFEKRLEQKISKIILGHADALDSTAGKLGATQGEDNPISQALSDIQVKDGKFIENTINKSLFPKLRSLGFNIPDDAKFEYKNDSETGANNNELADIAVKIKNAGLQIDAEYFEAETGIKVSTIAPTSLPPIASPKKSVDSMKDIINKLGLYD